MNWPHILTAMITPFDPNGDLDCETAGRLAAWLTDHGSDGLVVAGTTGESPTLSEEERRELFRAVRSAAPRHIPVWVGTGGNNTREAVAATAMAESWGADGVLVVTPYYNKPPQYALVEHFSHVAAATSLPVMLYNVPGRTGVNLEPATVLQIAERNPNVLAVKEASGNLTQMAQIVAKGTNLKLYAGDDALFYPALGLGAEGVVSVASHIVGDALAAMYEHWRMGRIAQSRQLHLDLLPVFEELFRLTNPIPVKWALSQLGWPVKTLRLPLAMPADESVFEQLGAFLGQHTELIRQVG